MPLVVWLEWLERTFFFAVAGCKTWTPRQASQSVIPSPAISYFHTATLSLQWTKIKTPNYEDWPLIYKELWKYKNEPPGHRLIAVIFLIHSFNGRHENHFTFRGTGTTPVLRKHASISSSGWEMSLRKEIVTKTNKHHSVSKSFCLAVKGDLEKEMFWLCTESPITPAPKSTKSSKLTTSFQWAGGGGLTHQKEVSVESLQSHNSLF